MRLTIAEIEMLVESLDMVGWGATRNGKPTELGRAAEQLREKLRREQRRLANLASGAAAATR